MIEVSLRAKGRVNKFEGNISVLLERCKDSKCLTHNLWPDGVALQNRDFMSIGHESLHWRVNEAPPSYHSHCDAGAGALHALRDI